jgi:hypothetical protein
LFDGREICSDVCFINERNKHFEREGDFGVDDRITLVLSEELFLSVRQVAKKATMSKSTVDLHFTPMMRSKQQHLTLVPYSLTESAK